MQHERQPKCQQLASHPSHRVRYIQPAWMKAQGAEPAPMTLERQPVNRQLNFDQLLTSNDASSAPLDQATRHSGCRSSTQLLPGPETGPQSQPEPEPQLVAQPDLTLEPERRQLIDFASSDVSSDLWLELESLPLSVLLRRVRASCNDENLIDEAVDADQPRKALRSLLLVLAIDFPTSPGGKSGPAELDPSTLTVNRARTPQRHPSKPYASGCRSTTPPRSRSKTPAAPRAKIPTAEPLPPSANSSGGHRSKTLTDSRAKCPSPLCKGNVQGQRSSKTPVRVRPARGCATIGKCSESSRPASDDTAATDVGDPTVQITSVAASLSHAS